MGPMWAVCVRSEAALRFTVYFLVAGAVVQGVTVVVVLCCSDGETA